ncbi:MAG: zf-HC2 domain-containing protein [Gemmatimonadota bacterium]|nr:MAG: zf-HC2 domain-containing protein [Gemmatimonadota bacterium]
MTGSYDCDRIADLLPEFLAGRVSAEDDRHVREHLAACRECRNKANAVSLLQQTPIPNPDPDRWDYFVRGVVEETERKRWLGPPRRIWAVAAVLAAIAVVVFLWNLFAGVNRPAATGIDALAREVAELPEGEAAAWTAGLSSAAFMPVGFDTSGLSEEEIEQLVAEVGRS